MTLVGGSCSNSTWEFKFEQYLTLLLRVLVGAEIENFGISKKDVSVFNLKGLWIAELQEILGRGRTLGGLKDERKRAIQNPNLILSEAEQCSAVPVFIHPAISQLEIRREIILSI